MYISSIYDTKSNSFIGLVLWQINHCRLFNSRLGLYIVEKTGLFNLGAKTSLGEGKLNSNQL